MTTMSNELSNFNLIRQNEKNRALRAVSGKFNNVDNSEPEHGGDEDVYDILSDLTTLNLSSRTLRQLVGSRTDIESSDVIKHLRDIQDQCRVIIGKLEGI